MPAVHTKSFDIPAEAIDQFAHVNNLAYLRWMQEVAIEHSAALGWPPERYLKDGVGWVVRSHFIEYLRPAFEREAISIHTWISEAGVRGSTRRYLFVRDADKQVLARADTVWVFVSLRSGRAIPIPDDVRSAFSVVAPGSEVLRGLTADP